MTLRAKLLAAAAGIVVVSLLLSGALTWVLVRSLEDAAAQDQLDRSAASLRASIVEQQCATPAAFCAPGNEAPADVYTTRLDEISRSLGGDDRLLLLDSGGSVLYDSAGSAAGERLRFGSRRFVGGRTALVEVDGIVRGVPYIGAASPLPVTRNPLRASFAVLARSRAALAGAALSDLLPKLVLAGGIALAIALAIALLLSRALAGPLMQLAAASDDIARGNYSRRVSITGSDEIGVLGSAFNRMAQAVERARASQRDFIANVSHELKTPLTSLIGFSQALVDGSLRTDDEKARAAVILHEEAQRVLRLAQELLDLARVEGGQLPLHLQPVDLGGLLRHEVEVAGRRAAGRQLALAVDIPHSLPPVRADPERVHQIVDNVIDNALKYAPVGSAVQVAAESENGVVRARFSNRVTGPPPDPERIFERFYRGDPARSADQGGVGLGLAISRELAAALQGRLWADLGPAGELRVWLSLPAERDVKQPA